MGAMEVVPFLGSNFNKLLPLFLMIHCFLILFNIWHRMAAAVAPSYLQFDAVPGDDESYGRGRLLIKTEQVYKTNCMLRQWGQKDNWQNFGALPIWKQYIQGSQSCTALISQSKTSVGTMCLHQVSLLPDKHSVCYQCNFPYLSNERL